MAIIWQALLHAAFCLSGVAIMQLNTNLMQAIMCHLGNVMKITALDT